MVIASAFAQGQGRAEQLRVPQAESVCLNEFLPKPAGMSEFIELYSGSGVSLAGWEVGTSPNADCTRASYKALSGTLDPGGFLAVYGLALRDNSGCVLLLRDGVSVEKMPYSSSQSGKSIGRKPDGGAWHYDLLPSPGRSNTSPPPSPAQSATPTFTRTSTPSRTRTSTPSPTRTRTLNYTPGASATVRPTRNLSLTVCLSEFMPAPHDVDWDGDGEANYEDEWIELHNASSEEVDLWGWVLDDQAGGGTAPYTFPAGTRIPAGGFRAFYLRQTGVILNNSGGDEVRLLAPEGTVVDLASYEETTYDVSYSRLGGCGGEWVTGLPPSPGEANPVPTATPTLASVPLYLPLLQRLRS